MPTINVRKDLLLKNIGKEYTDQEFDDLCFRFGIELDEVTTEAEIQAKMGASTESSVSASVANDVIYRIEIPANRYDLLCMEGLSRALAIFEGLKSTPVLKTVAPNHSLRLVRKRETSAVRKFVVAAVLRGVKFTPESYASFIDLQDKLHQNIGRRRKLASIGTHDLDTIQGPFSYEAKPQKAIKFQALKETKEMNVEELFAEYHSRATCYLKPFLHLTETSPVHPVIYDAKGVVLSLPPIINGSHSKVTLDTKNLFIECTGLDLTKIKVVLNTVVAMFAEYCTPHAYHVEQVEIVDEETNSTMITPDLSDIAFAVPVDYVNDILGLKKINKPLKQEEIIQLLKKMQLNATNGIEKGAIVDSSSSYHQASSSSSAFVTVRVPPTRSDILHACDIAEDVAIAYGYNNISYTLPTSYTIASQQPLNRFADQVREQAAQAGFNEVLTWVLSSVNEQFDLLRIVDPEERSQIVELANSKAAEFSHVRVSLLPGLLQTLRSNKSHPLPIRIFECGEVAVLDGRHHGTDVGAHNVKKFAAVHCGFKGGFEQALGLVHRIMEVLSIPFASRVSTSKDEKEEKKSPFARQWHFEETNLPPFLERRSATIVLLDAHNKTKHTVGRIGLFHPDVLKSIEIEYPIAGLELDLSALF